MLILILNESELNCLHASIAIVSTQSNSSDYYYLTLRIQFNINHLFVDSSVVPSIAI